MKIYMHKKDFLEVKYQPDGILARIIHDQIPEDVWITVKINPWIPEGSAILSNEYNQIKIINLGH